MSDLFDQMGLPACRFDGFTYEPRADQVRLTGQLLAVYSLMRDGRWRSLAEVGSHVKGSEAAISARLRDLRKVRFGAHTVERRRRGPATAGVWEYRLVINESA